MDQQYPANNPVVAGKHATGKYDSPAKHRTGGNNTEEQYAAKTKSNSSQRPGYQERAGSAGGGERRNGTDGVSHHEFKYADDRDELQRAQQRQHAALLAGKIGANGKCPLPRQPADVAVFPHSHHQGTPNHGKASSHAHIHTRMNEDNPQGAWCNGSDSRGGTCEKDSLDAYDYASQISTGYQPHVSSGYQTSSPKRNVTTHIANDFHGTHAYQTLGPNNDTQYMYTTKARSDASDVLKRTRPAAIDIRSPSVRHDTDSDSSMSKVQVPTRMNHASNTQTLQAPARTEHSDENSITRKKQSAAHVRSPQRGKAGEGVIRATEFARLLLSLDNGSS
jgi:hypothetical protein